MELTEEQSREYRMPPPKPWEQVWLTEAELEVARHWRPDARSGPRGGDDLPRVLRARRGGVYVM
jgi:hypothetical protein